MYQLEDEELGEIIPLSPEEKKYFEKGELMHPTGIRYVLIQAD